MSTVEMKRFDLSVIRPVKNKPGELVFEMTVTDTSVVKAVAYVKSLLSAESELIVLQTASVIHNAVIDPDVRSAILIKLGLNDPKEYDRVKAEVEYNLREAKLDALMSVVVAA